MAEIEDFLKNTITGILILSCTASIAAVFFIKLFKTLFYSVIPRYKDKIRSAPRYRAYKSGYSASYIDSDKTGRVATAYFFFHLSKIVLWSAFLVFCFTVFTILVVNRGPLSIDLILFTFPFMGFIAAYKLYDRYEYIRIMYLSFWKKAMEHADKCFNEAYPDGINSVKESSTAQISDNDNAPLD